MDEADGLVRKDGRGRRTREEGCRGGQINGNVRTVHVRPASDGLVTLSKVARGH